MVGDEANSSQPLIGRIWGAGEDEKSIASRVIPDFVSDKLGFKNWKLSDRWMGVESDRTPKTKPEERGRFQHHEDGGANYNAGGGGIHFLGDDWGKKLFEYPFNPVKYPERGIEYALSTQYISPLVKNVFTDMGCNLQNRQGSVCEDFETNAMECLEYYGTKQGLVACKDWYDDYIECVHMSKQKLRVKAMLKKRLVDHHLEYIQGKRTWSETYEPPPKANAFIEPWHDPKFSRMQGREV